MKVAIPHKYLTVRILGVAGPLVSSIALRAQAEPATPELANQVAAVFARRCDSCHGPERQEHHFRLDDFETLKRGGDSGKPAVTPGDIEKSEIFRRIVSLDENERMPHDRPPLPATEVSLIEKWIRAGAPGFPRSGTRHWAFQPIKKPALPELKSYRWPRNEIDYFILAGLDRRGIMPSGEADPITLLRRVHFDLTGLPPGPGEVEAYLKAGQDPGRYEQTIDRLLQSPHFGERWGRHWLDLARYADSDGYEKDRQRPFAYLYRDWVIEAINAGMPFDQFTIEQLAGDLLPRATLSQRIATGFHRNTLKNTEGGVDQEEDRCKIAVDRVNTTASVWLGLTMACAHCHSHKYDPISQKEYFGVYAFFDSVKDIEIDLPKPGRPQRGEPGRGNLKASVLSENPDPPRTYVHIRGDFLRKGDSVAPHTPKVLPPLGSNRTRPNRLDLARWIVAPENPLPARVAVNRTWQHLFGRGLVRTENDFGTRGERPTHPGLLDWLAAELIERDWSQKQLIKRILMSATYRQSSRFRPALDVIDPGNRLLARQNRYRLEAEIVRDIFLDIGGILNLEIGGPSIRPPLPADIAALGYANSVKWTASPPAQRHRRGMYIFFQRTVPYPMLTTFDAPDANVTCTRRERSNTPLQSLTLLNDPVFYQCAQALGRRLDRAFPGEPERQLAFGFRLCTSRPPAAQEMNRLRALFHQERSNLEGHPEQAARLLGARQGPEGRDILSRAAITLVARTLLNLDECITRE